MTVRAARSDRRLTLWLAVAPFAPLLLLVLLTYVAAAAVNAYYTPRLEADAMEDLQAIARLKAVDLESWLQERNGDASNAMRDESLVNEVADLLRGIDPAASRDKVGRTLERWQTSWHYAGACLLTPDAGVVVASGDCALTTPSLRPLLERLQVGRSAHTELYEDGHQHFHIDWLAPIAKPGGGDGRPMAVVLLRVEAFRFLFPHINDWPGVTPSAEALLVRRDGDRFVVMTPSAHGKVAPMSLSFPLGDGQLPGAHAVTADGPGTFLGVDHRHVQVLSAYVPVADTPWRVLVKQDVDEVVGPFRSAVMRIAAVVSGALLAFGLLYLHGRNQRAALREQLRQEQINLAKLALRRSTDRLAAIFRLSPIPVVVATADAGRLIEVSPSFERVFGWSSPEIVGRTAVEIGLWPDVAARERWRNALVGDGQLLDFHADMLNSAGERVHTSISSVASEIEGRLCVLSFISDITERKSAEIALLESRRRLNVILEGAADAIFICDTKGFYQFVNAQASVLLGYERDELLRMNMRDITPPEDASEATALFRDLVEAGQMRDELRLLRKDGSRVPVEINATRLPDGSLFGSCRDISERKAAMAQIRKFSLVVEQSPVSVVITDLEGRIEYVNEAFLRASGYERSEVLGQNPRILKSGRTPDDRYVALWAAITSGRNWVGELVNRRRDGVFYIEHAVILPLRDGERVTHYVSVKQDVTERKALELELERHRRDLERLVDEKTRALDEAMRELRVSEEHYRVAIDASNDGIWDWNLQTDEFHVNPAYLAMLGYEQGDLPARSGPKWTDLMDPAEREQVVASIRGRLQADGACETEYRLRQKDGRYKWILSRSKRVASDGQGRLLRAAGTHTDLSLRKRLEQDMREAKEAAERANRSKSVFLASMSHEIRTPMNTIIGLAHVLRHTPLNSRQVDALNKIDAAGTHLLSIINDVLDISKIEANRLELESIDFHLGMLLDNVHAMVAEQARQKGLEVVVEIGDVPLWLRGDATRLRQALLNLVNNAVKFTQRGRVTVRALREAAEAPGVRVRFEVEDTGIGVSAQQQQHLFQAFEQADASTTRKYGGTGLGLAITERLAQLMGGAVGLRSVVDHGSTFWFSAQLQIGQGDAASHAGDEGLQVDARAGSIPSRGLEAREALRGFAGRRVLIVDDVEMNRDLLVSLLEDTGLVCDSAIDGQDAVRLAGQNDYALILMDIRMPVMDGLEATRLIRQLPGRDQVPVIATTANIFREDRDACRQAGMADFVAKPFEPALLYATIARCLGEGGGTVADRGETRTASAPARAQAPPANRYPGMDTAAGQQIWRSAPDSYLRYLGRFATDHGNAVAQIRDFVACRDFQAATMRAHRLRGVAANLALVDVAQGAGEVEQQAKGTAVADASLVALQCGLDVAGESIRRFIADAAAPPPPVEMPREVIGVAVAEQFGQLMRALRTDDPTPAEPVVKSLQELLAPGRMHDVQRLLDDFDFRGAEVAVRHLCASLGVPLPE